MNQSHNTLNPLSYWNCLLEGVQYAAALYILSLLSIWNWNLDRGFNISRPYYLEPPLQRELKIDGRGISIYHRLNI